MTEIIDNVIQLAATGICMIIALRKGLLLQNRAWTILALASGVFFLGDLYWDLYLVLCGKTPDHSYIPYLSWYASYMFLLLLLFELKGERKERKHSKFFLLIPVFTAGMCVFYMQYGDWIGNIITAVFMSLLIWHALDILLSQKDTPKAPFSAAVLLFCAAEYAAWTASCFGTYDTWAHPYFWFDTLLSAVFLMFPAALGKAVDE